MLCTHPNPMIILKKVEYVKCVYLLLSSNHSPCYERIDFPVCTGREVFDRLVGMLQK